MLGFVSPASELGTVAKGAETAEQSVDLGARASEIHSTMAPITQTKTTTAVASVTTIEGKSALQPPRTFCNKAFGYSDSEEWHIYLR